MSPLSEADYLAQAKILQSRVGGLNMGKLWEPGPRYSQSRVQRNHTQSCRPWERVRDYRIWRKLLWQTLASVVILFLVLGVFQLKSPLAEPVQATVRGWFTQDYNIESVIRFFSAVGLWGDTFERAAMEVSMPEPLPLTVPVSGQITKPYGWVRIDEDNQDFHDGILIAAPENTPVRAALAGTVNKIANEEELGRVVEITDARGYTTTYGHCKEILVNLNDQIAAGQVIARVGKTGKAAAAQLFFRIVNKGESIDPAQLFMPAKSQT